MSLFLLFLSSFLVVFLLVFQQLNVSRRHYGLAAITSVAITLTQFIVVKGMASGGAPEMVFMSAGAVLGVLTSMASHDRLFRWRAARLTAKTAIEGKV